MLFIAQAYVDNLLTPSTRLTTEVCSFVKPHTSVKPTTLLSLGYQGFLVFSKDSIICWF